MNPDTINEHTIHVCALQRSGHHAVIQWIMINSGTAACFLNNCQPGTNPYFCATSTHIANSLLPSIDLAAERRGHFSRKPLLICNYEDQEIEATFPVGFSEAMANWIGPSARSTHLLVLRDPFNLIASKYRWAIHGHKWQPSAESLVRLPQLWKSHAREYLRLTSNTNPPLTTVNYNRWFTDDNYRRDRASALGISTADQGRDRVARWGPNGWGDSFDNLTFDGRATEMKVLDRWKHYATDPLFRLLVRDEELIDLSTQIFGQLPGLEALIGRG